MTAQVGEGAAPSRFSAGGYDYRLYAPFLFHAFLFQVVVALGRIGTTYRGLELELPIVWIGVISGAFALLPIFLAVRLGRWLDRGKDVQSIWIGSALTLLAAVGFWAWASSALTLVVCTLTLGVGHLCIMAGHQTLAVRCGETRHRDSIFGGYMVAVSIGQGAGPLLVGWIGGGLKIAPPQQLFTWCVAAAAVAMAAAMLLRPGPPRMVHTKREERVPVRELLTIRGFASTLLASVMTIASLDLLVVYLPVLGAERDIDAGSVGVFLTLRSFSTVISRMYFSRMIRFFGRVRLMIICLVVGGCAFALLAVPGHMWVMAAATILIGYGMGIASTLALSTVVALAPAQAQGTAVTLRITGNRIGQMTLPMLGGLAASASGAAGIMVSIGVALVASGWAVYASQHER